MRSEYNVVLVETFPDHTLANTGVAGSIEYIYYCFLLTTFTGAADMKEEMTDELLDI